MQNINLILGANSITQPLTGIGHYAKELAIALNHHNKINRLQLFADQKFCSIEHIPPPCEKKTNPITRQRLKTWLQNSASIYRIREMSRNYRFKQLIQSQKDCHSLYHELQTIMQPFAGPSITTVHDLSCLKYPEMHPKGRVKWFEKGLISAFQKASHIITVSNQIKNELVTQFSLSSDRVSTIYHGVNPIFKARGSDDPIICQFLKKYQLNYRAFILAVATREPRKNLNRLLDAYLQLNIKTQAQYPLVLVGGIGWKNTLLDKRIQYLQKRKKLICTGYVSQEELPLFYASAKLFIYPSLYEGFGLPVLEAMASKTPVITSKNTAMEEIVLDQQTLIDPMNPRDIQEKIVAILSDDALHTKLANQAAQQAKNFTWEKAAEKTVAIYERVMS